MNKVVIEKEDIKIIRGIERNCSIFRYITNDGIHHFIEIVFPELKRKSAFKFVNYLQSLYNQGKSTEMYCLNPRMPIFIMEE